MPNDQLTEDDVKRIYRDSVPVQRSEFRLAIQNVTRLVKLAQENFKTYAASQFAQLSQKTDEAVARIDKRLAEIRQPEDGKSVDHEKVVQDVLKGIRQPKDGETPIIDHQQIAAIAASLIPPPQNGADADPEAILSKLQLNLPALGAALRDGLELLQEDDRLDVASIRGLDEKLAAHAKTVLGALGPGGGTSFSLLQSGTQKVQQPLALDFKGTGAPTITMGQNGMAHLDFPGGGGTLTELTATGTINSSNTAFTFTSKPIYVLIDGTKYKENAGWTWNSGSLTATTTKAPDFSIWGEK